MKRFYYGCLWLAFGAVCWALCYGGFSAHAYRHDGSVSYRDSGGQVAFDDLRELRRQIGDTGGVTGWGQSLAVSVKSMALNESTSMDVIWVEGDASRIWAPVMLNGNMPPEGDDIGCALDEKTALKLFGSTDILGLEVRVGDADAVIRGVFAYPEGISALGVDPGRGLGFFAAALSADAEMRALEFTLHPEDGKTDREAAEAHMANAGINASGTFDDHKDAQNMMVFLMGLPGDLLALAVILRGLILLRAFARRRIALLKGLKLDVYARAGKWVRASLPLILGALATGGVIYAALRLSAHGGRIPATYLPTRWSDFSFWPGLMKELAQNGANARLSVALLPDMFRDRLYYLSAALSLAAMGLWLMALKNLRGFECSSFISVIAGILAVSAAPLLGLWLGGTQGWYTSDLPIAMRTLPPLAFLLWIVPGDFRSAIDFQH